MLKRTLRITKGVHGSALIMALVTSVVLVTLALAIISLSVVNLDVNQTDAMNNDAYYAAESGANSALEQLKQEVMDYYNEVDSGDYSEWYDNFFTTINGNAVENFARPEFNNELITDLTTTFSMGGYDADNDIFEFLISSTATAADDSQYQVDAKLYVQRLDVSQPQWLELDDVAYKIGGRLTLNSGYGVYNGGSVVTSELYNPKNQYYYVQPPGTFQIIAGISDTINDCLEYPSFDIPALTPTFTVTTNNMEINGNTVNPATGKKLFEEPNTVIVSNPGISFRIGWGCPAEGTIIYQRGSGTLTVSCSNTEDTTLTCYCEGNFVASNGPVYADAFVRGTCQTSGNFTGNIVCDSDCIEACSSFTGSLVCGGSISCNGGLRGSFFAEGPIDITNGNQGNNVIYSKTKVVVGNGNYQNAIIFSGGDIDITGGMSLTGAICAKGNITQGSWLTLNYSRSAIQDIMDDPDNTFFFGGGSGGGEMEVNKNIIIDQEVTAVGRIN